MGLESADYISQLVPTNPVVGDPVSQGDDHLRLIKEVLAATFPNASKSFRFPNSGALQTASFAVSFPTDQHTCFFVDTTAGAVTVTLPDPTSGGTSNEDGFGFFILKYAGDNAITLSPAGGQTIMGASNAALVANGQWEYVFWAGTINQWFLFEGMSPVWTHPVSIVTANDAPLSMRRSENSTSELELVYYRVGNGSGNAALDTIIGDGAHNVVERRRYMDATEVERMTDTDIQFGVDVKVGDNVVINSDGFAEFTDIAEPAVPAAGKVRLAMFDDFIGAKYSDGEVNYMWASVDKAHMETLPDEYKVVLSRFQKDHPGHPKAGGNLDGSGTPAFRSDYGMGAITDGGTGNYTLAFDTSFANTNYWCTAFARINGAGSASAIVSGISADTKTASAFQIKVRNPGNEAANDSTEIGVSFWGQHA